jgi:hypothetical protein
MGKQLIEEISDHKLCKTPANQGTPDPSTI